MAQLQIEKVENGFIVSLDSESNMALKSATHVFQSAQGLGEFIQKWGENQLSPAMSTLPPLPVLKRGEVLLIIGGLCSGKTTKAIEIADRHGDHTCRSLSDFEDGPFNLREIFESEPDTVIIEDELNEIGNSFNLMMSMIVSDRIKIDIKGDIPKHVKTPRFIVCTGAIDPIKLASMGRRFTILKL